MTFNARTAATVLCTVAASLLAASAPRAESEHVDLLVQEGCVDLCVGGFDFVSSAVLAEKRSFPVALGEVEQSGESLRYQTESPGFVSRRDDLPAGWGLLPGDSDLLYFFLSDHQLGRNLSYWDGLADDGIGPLSDWDVEFGPVPDGEVFVGQISVGFLEFEITVADGADEEVGGSRVATTDPGGGLHNHVSFFLYGDDSPVSVPSEPAADEATPGIYLVALGVALVDESGNEPIEQRAPPAYALYAAGEVDPGALDAATQWVDTFLVPEPSAAVSVAAVLAALAVLGGRRSRRVRSLAATIGSTALVLGGSPAPAERLPYTEGHCDLEVVLVDEDGEPGFEALDGLVRAEGAVIADELVEGPTDYAAEEIEIVVPDSTRETLTQQQIDFFGLEPIGVDAGEPVWILPQDQIASDNRMAPFLGISASDIGAGLLEDDRLRLQLVQMQAPPDADFSVWQSTFEPPTVFAISTADGLDDGDFFSVGAASHAHYNLGFTRPGSYELTFEPRAILEDSDEPVTGSVTYLFTVPEPTAWAARIGALAALAVLTTRRSGAPARRGR